LPRSGVALVVGKPYYFDCRFSEELDDYTDQFRLWPVPGDELADELEAWQMFAAWGGEYDSGLRPGPFPGGRQSAALERMRRRRQRQSPPGARTAIPSGALSVTARLRPGPYAYGPLDYGASCAGLHAGLALARVYSGPPSHRGRRVGAREEKHMRQLQ
jgi:hypothetical protein